MKTINKIILLLIFSLLTNIACGQNRADAENLVKQGVAYHDKGNYEQAIAKYDKALELDKDNLLALTEKAFSLLSQKKNDEAIINCKKAFEKHPGEKGLSTVYVIYGNALDGLKKPDQSLEIYDQGIELFPEYYPLHYNKGVTLINLQKYDAALLSFQNAVLVNPNHASSHNGIARFEYINNRRIPAILAYSRFLVLEPQSQRAKDNIKSIQKLMSANVTETGKKTVTINISPEMFGDTTKAGTQKENCFNSTDLILSMSAALDYDKKNKKKSEIEQFIRKFETICSSLKETRKDNFGIYWDYYAPYFIEMKEKNFVETFAYIAFASSDDPKVEKWLKANKNAISKFYDWSNNFSWESGE